MESSGIAILSINIVSIKLDSRRGCNRGGHLQICGCRLVSTSVQSSSAAVSAEPHSSASAAVLASPPAGRGYTQKYITSLHTLMAHVDRADVANQRVEWHSLTHCRLVGQACPHHHCLHSRSLEASYLWPTSRIPTADKQNTVQWHLFAKKFNVYNIVNIVVMNFHKKFSIGKILFNEVFWHFRKDFLAQKNFQYNVTVNDSGHVTISTACLGYSSHTYKTSDTVELGMRATV